MSYTCGMKKLLYIVVLIVLFAVTIAEDTCDETSCKADGGFCEGTRCWCNEGFYGEKCKKQSDTCSKCKKNEACTTSGDCSRCSPKCTEGECMSVDLEGPKCLCNEGYGGEDCSETVPLRPNCSEKSCGDPNGWCKGNECWCNSGYFSQSCKKFQKACTKCTDGEACTQNGKCSKCNPACSNHGTCTTVEKGGPRCDCDNGWTGDDCSIKISDQPEPCSPQTCHSPGGFCEEDQCVCNKGYYTDNCRRYVIGCETCPDGHACDKRGLCAPCDPPCGKHGECTTINKEGPKCFCDKGWTGPDCKEEIQDKEDATTCKMRACYSPNGWCDGDTCWCNPGHYHIQCKLSLKACNKCEKGAACNKKGECIPCDPPCAKNGECLSVAGDNPRCYCKSGWTGADCSEQINPPPPPKKECDPLVCQGRNGWCNGTQCWCSHGGYSDNCKRFIRDCENCPENQACDSDGVCVACNPACTKHGECVTVNPDGPKCLCDKGWGGKDCGKEHNPKPPPAESNACQTRECHGPNAWCKGPTCWCNDGYYGKECRFYSENCTRCMRNRACDERGSCDNCKLSCSTNGHCTAVGDKGPKCLCDEGWLGPDCETRSSSSAAMFVQSSLVSIVVTWLFTQKSTSL